MMSELVEKRTCTQCRKSKVKCDKSNPCSRCIRLGLNCVEQVRGRGRPYMPYGMRPGMEGVLDPRDLGHYMPGEYDPGYHHHMHPQPQPTQWTFTPLSLDNPESAQPVIQDFFRDEGRLKLINRRKLLIVLRSWGLTARTKKTQAFFKTVQTMASTFQLELKDILNMEPEVYRELCNGEERKAWAFNPLELPLYVNALDCEASAVSKRVVIDGESRYYNNEMFSSLFHSSEESDRMFEKSTGYDVWLSCIDQEDRKEFYEACLSSILLQPSMSAEACKVFKCKDKNGRSFLGVVRMRSMFFSAGDYVGYSFSITPIPNSKYFSPVTATPEPTSSAARLRAFVDLKAPLTLSTLQQPSHHAVTLSRPPTSFLDQPPSSSSSGVAPYPFHHPPGPPAVHHHRVAPPSPYLHTGSSAATSHEDLRWAPGMGPASSGPAPVMGGMLSTATMLSGGAGPSPSSQHSLMAPSQQAPPGLLPAVSLTGAASAIAMQGQSPSPTPGQVGVKRGRPDREELEAEAERERTIAATLQRMCQPQMGAAGGLSGNQMGSSSSPLRASPMPMPPSSSSGPSSSYPGSLSLLGGVASQVSGPVPASAASTLAQYLRSSVTGVLMGVGGTQQELSPKQEQELDEREQHEPHRVAPKPAEFGSSSSISSSHGSDPAGGAAEDFYSTGVRPPSPTKVITQI